MLHDGECVGNCRDTAVQEISWNPFTGLPFGRSVGCMTEGERWNRKKERMDQNYFYVYNFSGVHDVLSTIPSSFALSFLSFPCRRF